MFVPTMIFGHLLTSSNFNEEEKKVTGAKLCNIFSTKFVVETASKEYKKYFKQVRDSFKCIYGSCLVYIWYYVLFIHLEMVLR